MEFLCEFDGTMESLTAEEAFCRDNSLSVCACFKHFRLNFILSNE